MASRIFSGGGPHDDGVVIGGTGDSLVLGNVASVAAAGTNQATAAALTGTINVVTGASGSNGVILPVAKPGMVVIVYSSAATNGLPVFPATGGTINNGTANAAVTIKARTFAMFVATSSTNWTASFTANA